jgi:glycosyltransferase involved in cell wall biosynthesis
LRLLWLLPDLGYTAAARQATLVVPHFKALGHDAEVAVLRSGGAFTQPLRDAGVCVRELASPQDLGLRAAFAARRLATAGGYDVIHAWCAPAVRAVCGRPLARLRTKIVASRADRGGRAGPLDRLLQRRTDFIAEAPSVPLAIAAPPEKPPALGLDRAAGSRLIICLGALTPEHGYRDALWAFDVLKFVDPTLELAVIGDGRERERLVRFIRSISGGPPRVHFLPARVDGSALLAHAEVVWVPSRRPSGEQVVLEAQAAGVPVVATRLPELARLIDDGRTGVLAPVGDAVALAKATRPLLDDAELRRRVGAAARAARSHGHAPADVAGRWADAYEAVR